MNALWLRRNGRNEGPLAADEIQQRFETGELPAAVMSWSSGEHGWQSLGRRWGAPQKAPLWQWLTWLLLLAGMVVLLSWNLLWDMHTPPVEQSGARLMASGAILAAVLALLAIGLALATFRLRGRLTPSAVYALAMVALAIALALPQQRIRATVLGVLQASPDASVQASEDGSRITVSGAIGPRLLANLEKAHVAHSGARLLVIDSPGGLLNEAERVGQWVAANKLTVRIQNECSSACVLVWAAASQRQMQTSARLGLHNASSRLDLPNSALSGMLDQADRKYRRRLHEAGFDQALLDIQQNTNARDMHWLTAVELIDHHIKLVAVDAAGEPVSDARLRWESVIALRGEGSPAAALMSAVAAHLPRLVDEYASKMYSVAHVGRPALLDDALLTDVKWEALMRASNQAVLAWWEPERQMYIKALQTRDVPRCEALTGDGRGVAQSLVMELNLGFQSRLTELVNTLPELGTSEAMTTTSEQVLRDKQAYLQLTRLAYLDQVGKTLDNHPEYWDAMQRCAFVAAVNRQVQKLPVAQRAAMVRHIALRLQQ